MSFVRSKEIPPGSGNWYDYEVKTVHEGKKVRQEIIRYIGPSGKHGKRSTGGRANLVTTKPDVILSQPEIKTTCKICQSKNTRKFGTYKGVQNYFCNDCKTKFTGTDALPRHRVSPSFVASALNEFYAGMSFHDIENNIETQTNGNISHTAVIKWVNKYTDEAIKATKDLHPKVGDTWIADETFVRVDKSKATVKNPYWKEQKEKWVVFWDIIDAKTRFLLASRLTTTRTTNDAKALMDMAQERAGKMPKIVVTDKLSAYMGGIKQSYGTHAKHIQGSPFELKNDSNLIERFHGSLKERTKVMRAQKNKTTLQRFTDGWLVDYNFFRPHMSLKNRPPAEVAGLKYDWHNWADVVGYQKEPLVKTLEPESA
jgi:transposase-like protein/ribosomal protein L37AE/L43A